MIKQNRKPEPAKEETKAEPVKEVKAVDSMPDGVTNGMAYSNESVFFSPYSMG